MKHCAATARQPGTFPVLVACANRPVYKYPVNFRNFSRWAISKAIMDNSMTTKPSPKSPESAPKPPVLRLRGTTENEELEEEQLDLLRFPDGPWTRHPDEIDDSICALSDTQFPLDINVENYRINHQENMAALTSVIRQWPKSEIHEHMEVKYVSTITQLVDMERILETSEDDDIKDAIERSFVHCDTYGVDPTNIVC